MMVIEEKPLRILRLPEVLERTGFSKSTLQTRIQTGLWVPSVSLGARSIGFVEHEIDALLAALINGKTDDEIKSLIETLIKKRKMFK